MLRCNKAKILQKSGLLCLSLEILMRKIQNRMYDKWSPKTMFWLDIVEFVLLITSGILIVISADKRAKQSEGQGDGSVVTWRVNRMNKNSVKYFGIWVTIFFVFGIILALFAIHYAYTNNLEAMDIPEKAKSIVGIAVLVLFCPPLYIIHNIAKNEKNKSIMVLSLFLLILICTCVLSTIIR